MISESDRRKLLATGYLEARLSTNPQTSRFSHCLAALYDDQQRPLDTDKAYKNAMKHAPNNVMIRNDYALYLAKENHKQEAVEEIQKALLQHSEQPTLNKNLGAIEASRGNYIPALASTQQAVHINSHDIVNHRNFARVKSVLGDTRISYHHNQVAMQLETQQQIPHPDVNCMRTCAIQNITLGGDHAYSISLIDKVRKLENKKFDKFEFSSTRRTNEIINNISLRKGHPMEVLEKILKENEEKRQLEEAVRRGDVSSILAHRGFGKNQQQQPQGRKKS